MEEGEEDKNKEQRHQKRKEKNGKEKSGMKERIKNELTTWWITIKTKEPRRKLGCKEGRSEQTERNEIG